MELTNTKTYTTIKSLRITFVFLTSVLITMFATKSSPLFPFNDWVDANAYFTVGKSILKGYVPYRDLYDHKGPILFFIHALASFVSYDSFFGVYIFELISCFFFLSIAYNTIKLYTDEQCICMIPLIAVSVYSLPSFVHGDSVEELCLPIFMYAVYVGIISIRQNRIPNFKEGLLIGITSACVLWMKYTLLGIYLGWVIVPFIISIKNKQIVDFLKLLLSILIGVVAVSSLVLLYFALNHSVKYLFEVYFYDNIFLYGKADSSSLFSIYYNVTTGFRYVFDNKNFTRIIIMSLLYLFIFHKKKVFELVHISLCFISMFIIIFAGGKYYNYYSLPLAIFNVFWVCLLYEMAKLFYKKFKLSLKKPEIICSTFVLALSVFMIYFFGNSKYMLFEKNENLPQYKVKSYIESSGIENPTFLNYNDLDRGFYTVLGIVPSIRYFYQPNIDIPICKEEQDACIKSGKIDFIVATNPIDSEGYKLVDCYTYYFEAKNLNYYFYQQVKN